MRDSEGPSHEAERLEELRAYAFLYDHRKEELERLCLITKQLLGAHAAFVNLVDEHQLKLRSTVDASTETLPRAGSFCDVTIGQGAVLELHDTRRDPHFTHTKEHLHIRHYAGVPLAPDTGPQCRHPVLSKHMGTSVKMIEDHYGHINTLKNAERILQRLPGWQPISPAVPLTQSGRPEADGAERPSLA